jgi:glycerophosphoryl diester phosphodiesterase
LNVQGQREPHIGSQTSQKTASPLVRIAHRGGGTLAPANSLAGIERSIDFGIEMIEVDIRRTLDGHLVLSHDERYEGSAVAIRASTLAELRADLGDVPTLTDALRLARGRAKLNLDIKEPDTLDDVLAAVRSSEATEACMVSCLHASCLTRLAEAEPGIPRFLSYPPDYGNASRKAWLTPAVDAVVTMMRLSMPFRLRGMIRGIPDPGVTLFSRLITPRLVDLAHRLGLQIYTWTVDDLAEMRRLMAYGVDGITSNRPDLLAELTSDTRPADAAGVPGA